MSSTGAILSGRHHQHKVIAMTTKCRDLAVAIGGKALHGVTLQKRETANQMMFVFWGEYLFYSVCVCVCVCACVCE